MANIRIMPLHDSANKLKCLEWLTKLKPCQKYQVYMHAHNKDGMFCPDLAQRYLNGTLWELDDVPELHATFKFASFFKPNLDEAKMRLIDEVNKSKDKVKWDERLRVPVHDSKTPRIPPWKSHGATTTAVPQRATESTVAPTMAKAFAFLANKTPTQTTTDKPTSKRYRATTNPAKPAEPVASPSAKIAQQIQEQERNQHMQQMIQRAEQAAQRHKMDLLQHLTMEIERAEQDPCHSQHLAAWQGTNRDPPINTNQRAARRLLASQPSLTSIAHLLYPLDIELTEGLYASIRWSCKNSKNVRILIVHV